MAIKGSELKQDFSAVSELFGSSEIEDPHSLYREYRRTQPIMEGDILAAFGVPSQADYANKGRQVVEVLHPGVADRGLQVDALRGPVL